MKDIELFNDHFQNTKHTEYQKRNLSLPIFHTTLEKMPTGLIRLGTSEVITLTEKANLPERHSLIQTTILEYRSSCISAQRC